MDMTAQNHNSHDVGAGHFGSLLKHWRNVRRLTQIELAVDASVSARHLCFLETSRAQPSREMVQLLGGALDLPLEERNAMHVVFHPKGLRQFIVNWDEFAGQMIQILHREVAQGGKVAAQLLDEVMTYPGLPAEWRLPRHPAGSSPVMTMQLRKGEFRLAFF